MVGADLLHAIESLPSLGSRHPNFQQSAGADDLLLGDSAIREPVVVRSVYLVELVEDARECAQVGEQRAEAAGIEQARAFRIHGTERPYNRRSVSKRRPDGGDCGIYLGQRQHAIPYESHTHSAG
jgi:hypothetical protein